MQPRLRVTTGADKNKVYPLPPGRGLTVGNAQQCDICLPDSKLSPVHCRVQNTDGSVTVTDLRSGTGVFVNGERVTQSELYHGHVLKLGDTELGYESIGEWNVPSSPAEVKAAGGFDDTAVYDAPRAHELTSFAELAEPSAPASLDDVRQLANTGFGKFILGPVIGSGHHGVVFRARRSQEGPELALKVLDPAFPHSPLEAAQFKAVMQPRLSLRHPNLVTITGLGRNSSCSWLALELVEGESLAHMVTRFETSGVPGWAEAYRLAVHLARALHFAGRHHLVHRNLTPANVLYRPLDHLYKLADLPLAEALAATHLRQSVLRAKSRAELPYISPEQLQPQAAPDVRSDLYSLGTLVYLVLTGKPPFVGKNPTETAALIREATPAPPRQHQKSMPEAFEAAVFSLLAKRPEERFQTPAELLNDLARIEPDPA
jgi:serine/threonine-protein kinase